MDFSDIAGDLSSNVEEHDFNIVDTNDMFDGELLRVDQTPTQSDWKLVPLFMEDIDGSTKVWQIGYSVSYHQTIAEEPSFTKDTKCWQIGFSFPVRVKVVHGTLINSDGSKGLLSEKYINIEGDSSKDNKVDPNNILKTARYMYMDQYDKGYLPTGPELPSNCNGSKPMLAKTYHHPSNLERPKSNATRIKKFPVSVMRKLNGIRGVVKLRGNKLSIYSRLNNEFPHFQHIKDELKVFMKYLPPHSELDGELYALDLGIDQLKGAVKTVKSVHKHYKKVKYYIFDIIEADQMVWEERYTMLVNAYTKFLEDNNTSNYFTILQTHNCNNVEELDQYHDQFVSEGYEGLVIRRYGMIETNKNLSKYRSGRTNSLVKYKHFSDDEATIAGYDSNRKIVMVKDIRGNRLDVKMRGPNHDDWLLKNDIIGKQLTIRYSRLVDGVPVDPVGVTIRDYE